MGPHVDGPGRGLAPGGPRRVARASCLSCWNGEREAYLSGEPADDGRFVSVFAHSLEHIGGYTPEGARRAALSLLPDVMSYDPTRPASFPSNGRTLTDDAGDAFVAVLTNGRVTEDKVGPHSDLLPEFPYVGPPHKAA